MQGRALDRAGEARPAHWPFPIRQPGNSGARLPGAATQTFKSARSLSAPPRPVFMAKTSKTNPQLQRVVRELREVSREAEAPIWRDVAERLERSRKNWSEVNLSRLQRYATKGDQIVVPGVLLATGDISTAVTIAAFRASAAARKKIEAAGGRSVSLLELAVQNPKGAGIRLMG